MGIATILGLYATACGSIGGGGAQRMTSDLSTTAEEDRDKIGAGGAMFQIRATYTGFDQTQDANLGYHTWSVEIAWHARLADPTNERAFTEAANGLPTLQSGLAAPSFWKVAGVYDVRNIDFTEPPTREGNVISFAVAATIRTTTV